MFLCDLGFKSSLYEYHQKAFLKTEDICGRQFQTIRYDDVCILKDIITNCNMIKTRIGWQNIIEK